MTCTECGAKLVSSLVWKKYTPEHRATLRANRTLPHSGHGLCENCYRRRWRGPRVSLTRKVLLAEWKHFHDPQRSQSWNIRNLARILDRKPRTIEMGIRRAKKDGAL